jgi:alcohol dehydrogenase
MMNGMQAITFHAHGGPERLRHETVPTPQLHPDEVMIRVRAIALNGFDPMVLRGIPELPTPLPMIPCSDCAGDIVALGPAVDGARWRIGDRVSVMPIRPGQGMVGETLPGVAAEFCAVPQSALLPLPSSLSYVEAACLPTAYGTARRMIATRARVVSGERVLILGAAGGVGTCCVQLALQAGAEVIACAESDAALASLRRLGAQHTINTSGTDFLAEVVRRFGKPSVWGGGGIEVVVNFLGANTWARSLACLGRRGRLVTCGASAGYEAVTDVRYVWSFELDILGSNGWTLQDQADLLTMAAEKRPMPVIHAVRPLADYVVALEELTARKVIGKSVLEVA